MPSGQSTAAAVGVPSAAPDVPSPASGVPSVPANRSAGAPPVWAVRTALARQAVRLEESSQILDTLAESYFVNRRYAEAVETGKRALALAKGDRSHYEAQLRKFMAE